MHAGVSLYGRVELLSKLKVEQRSERLAEPIHMATVDGLASIESFAHPGALRAVTGKEESHGRRCTRKRARAAETVEQRGSIAAQLLRCQGRSARRNRAAAAELFASEVQGVGDARQVGGRNRFSSYHQ